VSGQTPNEKALLRRISELENEQARLHQVLDLLPHYLYVLDREGRYRMANRAAIAAVGQTVESIHHVKFQEVAADPAEGEVLLEHVRQALERGEPMVTPQVCFTPVNGSKQVLQLHEVPFRDDTTGEPWLLGIATDRTAEVTLQRERLDRARLERELDIAQRIQQGLFPTATPRCHGFRLTGWNRPAAATGGDFYDWFEAPDGVVYAAIGDVTGHGVGPALIAATTRAYLRATFADQAPLTVLVARLNDLLCGELPSGFFVTLAVVAIPKDPHEPVALIAAGHGPSYHRLEGSGMAEAIGSHGPPLGVLSGHRFEAADTFELDAGDMLMLISDGLFERRNEHGDLLGLPALEQTIAGHRGDGAGLIDALRIRADDFAGDVQQSDDMTAVVVERV